MKKTLSLIILLLSAIVQFAAPYFGQIQNFEQLDGSIVKVKLYGNEYYMRAESLDGYTVVRDDSTGWICYAKISNDLKELVSTGEIYLGGIYTGTELEKHIDLPLERIQEKAREKNLKLKGINKIPSSFSNQSEVNIPDKAPEPKTPQEPVSGKILSLTILVDFSDEPATVPVEKMEEFLNGDDFTEYGSNGSLMQYYSDISEGKVDFAY